MMQYNIIVIYNGTSLLEQANREDIVRNISIESEQMDIIKFYNPNMMLKRHKAEKVHDKPKIDRIT